jgi:retron-type reverse transcriptase
MKFMEHRVADPRILRLIRKWLKAGVSEDGKWSETKAGTPQGAVISPLLANVYLEFGRFAQGARRQRGKGKPATFTFLGFTHYCATNSKGHFVIRRKTMGQRMRTTLQAIKTQLRKRLHEPVNAVGQWLKHVVEGYYRYHAVPENLRALRRFRERLRHLRRSMLGRRSQRSGPSWKRIGPTFERWLPRARVLHPYPDVRFDAIHPR